MTEEDTTQVVKTYSLKYPANAAIFALVFGSIGIHKFYHGAWGWGILYILFFWTFIPAFVALIEGILYLTMPVSEYNRKYNELPRSAMKW